MDKKTKIWGVIIIIALLVGILSYYKIKPFAIGFQALSLGQVNFESNDPTIGGQAWLLTVSQNGAGQSASGTFTSTDNSNGATSNQFTITMNLDENYATYPIRSTTNYIEHVDYTTTTYNPLGRMGGCNPDYWDYYMHPSQFAILGTVFCYKYSTSGVYGTVSSANINFKSRITVQGTGGTESCVISNTGQSSCSSSDGNLVASWAGSLVSGQAAPQPSDQQIIAIYNTNKGGWMTSTTSDYNNWLNMKNDIANCLNNYKSTSCFDNLNNAELRVLNGKAFTTSGGNIAQTSGSQSNGQLVLQLPSQIQFPLVTMKIKASVIGINIPVGKPQITSTSATKFQTGQDGIITVTVKNIGTGVGTFDVSTSCTSGFYQKGNALRISGLAIGSSQTVYLPITCNAISGDSQSSCTIKAVDVNNPLNYATSSVSASCSAISICTAGERRISGSTIEECKNNAWVVIQSCNSTQTAKYVGGTPQCANTASGSSDSGSSGSLECASCDAFVMSQIFGSFWKSKSCTAKKIIDTTPPFIHYPQTNTTCAFSWIKLALVAIVFIVIVLVGINFSNSFSKKWEKIFSIIASIIVAGILSFLVFTLFWIGVIISIIAIVLFAVFKFII